MLLLRSLVVACALLAGSHNLASAQTAKPKPPDKAAPLDKELRAKISDLAARWWKARPATRFEDWNAKTHSDLEKEARALGEIPEGSTAEIVEMLWSAAKKSWKKVPIEKSKLVLQTPYGEAWAYLTNAGKGSPLIVGLHGGGEGAGSADEPRSNWQKKGSVGIYPQGIKLVHDTWNTVHGERFVLSLIEIAKVQLEIDPDRVYVAGFSMGGTGSWFMAGRHPDLFAAAAPGPGVFMASPKSQLAKKEEVTAVQHGLIPNVRNLPLTFYIGLDDMNCMPGTYLFVADVLDKLRKDDPEGWKDVHFKSYPDLAHEYPKGEPGDSIKFMFEHQRVRTPETLVWEYAKTQSPDPDPNEPCTRIETHAFYWLRCKDPVDRQWIRAVHKNNGIELVCRNTASAAKGITICLDATMIDVNADVVVKLGGSQSGAPATGGDGARDAAKELYRGRIKPDFWTILESMDERMERSMVFDRRIEL